MGQFPDVIKRLIDRFNQQSDQIRSPDYNETLLRIDFINPLMRELGWDMDNQQGFAEQYREVVHEDRVKVAGQTKAPDYSFRIGGQRKFFLEAKKPAVDIRNNWEPAYQLRRYAWSAKLACSLLTDFEELAIYDARIQPKQLEKASVARREFIRYTDYPDRWEFLNGTFSKDAVLKGEFDRYCESKKGRGAQLFDDAFLTEIEDWRKSIAASLARRNEALDEPALNFAVQRIIDRIIFLRIAEDRGTETVGQLQALLNGDSVYPRLVTLFNRADERYNSGLFHFVKEKDRDEAPDTLTPTLEVEDKTLKSIIKALYYPQSPYEFTMVSADILGSVYERFLGKVITLTAGHTAKIEEKPEVRKAGGVYYTPTYIVDYIVKNTVGKLLEGKTPREAVKLTVLDPACGSGSFLIAAYQFLLDWYLAQYTAADPAKRATGKGAVLRPDPAGDWKLTIAERKRILLDHLHGVDLDGQAVEVTKLNLLLKCLEGETSQTLGFEQRLFRERALPDLGKNILCGNSLIGTDIIGTDAWNAMSAEEQRRVNPFDYERAFPQIFKNKKDGGFDAVIGNPPYIRMEEFKTLKMYLARTYACHDERSDLYAYVMERSHNLIKKGGVFGMIVSNKFVRANYGKPLRASLAQLARPTDIVDFAGLPVFTGATVRTLIYIAERAQGDTATRYTPPTTRDRFPAIVAKSLTVQADVAERSYTLEQGWYEQPEWSFARPNVTALMRRLASHQKLGTYVDGQICMGVKSGLGDAFVISRGVRDALVAANAQATEVIKPLVNGRDIRRYCLEPQNQFLLYMTHGINIARYPSVEAHLRPFKAALQARATQQEWYELQQPQERFSALLDGPKIIFPDIATHPRFALDDEGYYGTNTVYFIPRTDRALLGLLNSKLGFFYFQQVCAGLEGGDEVYLRFFGQYLEGFPVAEAVKGESRRLVSLVDIMLSLHTRLAAEQLPQRREQVQREIDATDRQIDQLVYQLYGLSDAEIRIVEDATK